MQVKSIDSRYNCPNFGIKYIEPKSWDPEILKTLKESNLVKQIDSKYPDATVIYDTWEGFFTDRHVLFFRLEERIRPMFTLNFGDEGRINKLKNMNLEELMREWFDAINKPIRPKRKQD